MWLKLFSLRILVLFLKILINFILKVMMALYGLAFFLSGCSESVLMCKFCLD